MAGEKAKLLCSFGGEFVTQPDSAYYAGGKTRLASIDRSATFTSLLSKMSELCGADPNSLDIRFQLTDGSLDFRLISVETDEDVRNMMDEFDAGRKIPIFLFTEKNSRETPIVASEETISGPSMSGEMFRRHSQSLVVGQEYEDVQAFRIALTCAAVASNFKFRMIRSSPERLTARCAAKGCTWHVRASKFARVSGFKIRTLTTDHTCVRSEAAGARQAYPRWVAKCIGDKLRQNRNYKPKEIINDIYQEYGVVITYSKAYVAREKALKELRAEPMRDTVPVEDQEPIHEENQAEALACGEIHDPPRKKRAYKPRLPQNVQLQHCTRCNQIGHNKRTCTVPEPYLG